jgi:hypothetical protein
MRRLGVADKFAAEIADYRDPMRVAQRFRHPSGPLFSLACGYENLSTVESAINFLGAGPSAGPAIGSRSRARRRFRRRRD